jgi:endonuclease I
MYTPKGNISAMKFSKSTLFLASLCLIGLSSYAQIPLYYSSIDFRLSESQLKEQMSQLIIRTHTTELVYTPQIWDALKVSDIDPTNNGQVLLIYGYNDTDALTWNDQTRSKTEHQNSNTCRGKWNREHVYCRSLGTPDLDFTGPGADAHNLRAADCQHNSTRNNNKYTSGSGNASVISNGFYPGDEWRGDVARIIMYMFLRYPTQCLPVNIGHGSASIHPDMPDIFLTWNSQDPPTTYEYTRNDVFENLQGNRNPFIDNPYLATKIWGGQMAYDPWNISLSTQTVDQNNELRLLQNPTETEIKLIQPTATTLNYQLVNGLGQVQKAGQLEPTATSINIEELTSGIYYLQVFNANSFRVLPVIKK